MPGTKDETENIQRSKHQYYYLGDVERKLRKKIGIASSKNDKEKVADLWDKLHEIRNKRKDTEYYKLIVSQKSNKLK